MIQAAASAQLQLALLFLKLGVIGFGGPAAHIAIMEGEVVTRRGWMSRQEFLDLVGATNLIPGPNSTELAIHIGFRMAGWPGLLIAGCSFILPAALIVSCIALLYVRFGSLPAAEAVLRGIQPVVLAIILHALWRLGKTSLKTRGLAALAASSLIAAAAGVNELLILIAAGLTMLALRGPRKNRRIGGGVGAGMMLGVCAGQMLHAARVGAASVFLAAVTVPYSLATLFLNFVKVGAVLFGSGYVLFAFLRSDLVERLGWLTEAQLVDAIAVGQMTPGPVFTTATFVGYLVGGAPGAIVATIGIFLPAFVFVAVSAPLLPRLLASVPLRSFLDGVNAASLALMAVVTWYIGARALVSIAPVIVAGVSAALLFRTRLNSAWLVLAGAALGFLRMV